MKSGDDAVRGFAGGLDGAGVNPRAGKARPAIAAGAYTPGEARRLFGKRAALVVVDDPGLAPAPRTPSGLHWAEGGHPALIRAGDVDAPQPVPGEAGELVDFESVEGRLLEAFDTLRQLPDPAPGPKVRIMALWREVLPERVDLDGEGQAARPGVSRELHRRMDEALAWCERLSGDERRIVGMAIEAQRHATQVDWVLVRRKLRSERTTDALRKAYSRALSRICGKLNAGAGRHFG